MQQARLKLFFIEGFGESLRNELDDLSDAVEQGRQPPVSGEDGRIAVVPADAAEQSAETGSSVRMDAAGIPTENPCDGPVSGRAAAEQGTVAGLHHWERLT